MKNRYLIASGAVALSLLMVAPAFADSERADIDGHANIGSIGLNSGLHLGIGGLIKGMDNDNDGDNGGMHRDLKSASTTFGVVSAVNGSVFTISPTRKHATTTVTTNASTVYTLNGQATTSSALTAGSHVVVVGTTTATSSSGVSITASLVAIFTNFGKHFGFLRHWMNR